MSTTKPSYAAEERLHFGGVTLVINRQYGRILIIATPDFDAADWKICLLELGCRYGTVGDIGDPEWGRQGLWVWDLPIPVGAR